MFETLMNSMGSSIPIYSAFILTILMFVVYMVKQTKVIHHVIRVLCVVLICGTLFGAGMLHQRINNSDQIIMLTAQLKKARASQDNVFYAGRDYSLGIISAVDTWINE